MTWRSKKQNVASISHGIAMADFDGNFPDHRHNKAVVNQIFHCSPWRPLSPCRSSNEYRKYPKYRKKMVAAEHEEEELQLMKKKVGADEEEGRG